MQVNEGQVLVPVYQEVIDRDDSANKEREILGGGKD